LRDVAANLIPHRRAQKNCAFTATKGSRNMINKIFARGAAATAFTLALAFVPAAAQEALPAIDIGAGLAQPGDAPGPSAPAPVTAPGFSPERMALPVYRDPPGQTVTSIDTKMFENESIRTLGDILDYSPGVTIATGNSPGDQVISIRGSGRTGSTGLSNILLLQDGFSMQLDAGPNGGYTFAYDPHAYGAVDVYRGGSSALWGNYAMEGAINFRMRSGASINGIEIGSEYGSYGTEQSWAIAGKKVGDFDLSLFGSQTVSDGYQLHTGSNSQSFNFLGTWSPNPTDRVIVRALHSEFYTDMLGRDTWMQYLLNPFQTGYGCAYQTKLNAPFCIAVAGGAQPFNSISGAAAATQSPKEDAFHRNMVRDFIGLRYEHDFEGGTTWRTQMSYDYNTYVQPNNPTQTARGPAVALNGNTDITSHAPIFGMQATHFFQLFYDNTHYNSGAYWDMPFNFNPNAVGALTGTQSFFQSNMGLKAREELALTQQLTAVVGFSSTWSKVYGLTQSFSYPANELLVPTLASLPTSAALTYWNYAPEATLTYRYSPEWLFRARYETAYNTPSASALFTTSEGVSGDNTSLKSQTSQGFDVGFDWTPAGQKLKASVTLFNEWWLNEFASQLAPNGVSYSSNIPSDIHRGVEATIDWRPYEGWRLIGNYSYFDFFFKNFAQDMTATYAIQRSGDRLPGVPKHQFTGRIGYDQPYGLFKGLGAFVEYQYRSDYPMDNGNLIWAPGYGVVNTDIHYSREIENSYLKKVTVYFSVRNIFNTTYISSIANISDSLIAGTLIQAPAATLASSVSAVAGAPRTLTVGVKLKF
jgi:iron complex outermembrane receptor protein